jgi:UDP-N-acetylmuramate--alanine ligase
VLVGFQPHRYSRTEELFEEFSTAFNGADELFVTPIYAAGESPRPGIDSDALVSQVQARGHRSARTVASVEALAEELVTEARDDDLIIIFGAGDVSRASQLVLDGLQGEAG